MVKPLSEQLADLSVRAKGAEDAVAAAKKKRTTKLSHAGSRHMLLLLCSDPKNGSRHQIRWR